MARKKKAELVEEAEALGVDPDGLKVAELEVAVTAAEQAAVAATKPVKESSWGRHAAHAAGSEHGVHLQLGHIVVDEDGVAGFQLATDFVLGRAEALVLAEELGFAAADNHHILTHTG